MKALLLIAAFFGAEPVHARFGPEPNLTWDVCGENDPGSPYLFILMNTRGGLTLHVWEKGKNNPPIISADYLSCEEKGGRRRSPMGTSEAEPESEIRSSL